MKPVCSMCRRNTADAHSHVIPRALHHDLRDGDDDLITAVPSDPKERERRSQSGVSDDRILCGVCEGAYSKYDHFLINAFRSEPVAATRWVDADSMEIQGAQYARVKLGLMHVLWRIHASTRPEFSSFRLELADAERLRELLLRDDPSTADEFAVLMTRFDPDPEFERWGWLPRVGQWPTGARMLQWYHFRWYVSINAAVGGMPAEFLPYCLRPGQPVLVTQAGAFRNSPVFRAMIAVARERRWHDRDDQTGAVGD